MELDDPSFVDNSNYGLNDCVRRLKSGGEAVRSALNDGICISDSPIVLWVLHIAPCFGNFDRSCS